MILEDYLALDAQKYPGKTALVCGSLSLSYAELWARVQERAKAIPKGQIITLKSSQSAEFVIEYFAIHLAGSVAVPLEKDTPDAVIKKIASSLEGGSIPEGSADILFTTGTTGKSKGVIISHKTILADAENLIHGQGFSHDLAFIIHGPLNHIGSLSKLYPLIMLGATIIILDGLKDQNLFFRALDYPAPKMATFFVPATIRMLLQLSAARLGAYKDKLDFIESGAAPLPHSDMLRLCELLPNTRLYNTYASTETGIIATYNFNDGRCQSGCLGRPMPHSRIVITDEGLISCQGDTLMSGYVNDPEQTARILRDGTVFTSDLGYIDGEGMLHLTGRQGDVINVGGFKVAPSEVEDAAMAHPNVKDCICISKPHPITGSAPKLLVVWEADGEAMDPRKLAAFLKERLEGYKVPLFYEQVPKIERTFNGKLNRKFYL